MPNGWEVTCLHVIACLTLKGWLQEQWEGWVPPSGKFVPKLYTDGNFQSGYNFVTGLKVLIRTFIRERPENEANPDKSLKILGRVGKPVCSMKSL